MSRRCIIVLGLPRSGTSLVAGVLHHLGVFMGEKFTTPDFWNPRGYSENLEITGPLANATGSTMTDGVLYVAASGQTFCLPQGVLAEITRRMRDIEAKHEIWGFKDPRLLFPGILDDLLGSIESKLKFIVTVRQRSRIKASIEAKLRYLLDGKASGLPVDAAIDQLAMRLVDIMAGLPSSPLVVRFDSLIDSPEAEVKRIADFVNLKVTREVLEFPEPLFRRF